MKQKTVAILVVLFVSCFLVGGQLLARQTASAAEEKLTIPRLSHSPKIDGVLDEVYEGEALKIEDFVQLSPKENGQPSEKTVAYLGYDEKNLYLAFRCFDSEPKKIRCSVTARDKCLEDDWVIIFLDTFGEKRRAFTFVLNPIGIQADFMRVEEGGNDNMDDSWDTFFLSDGKMDDLGYVVEAAIPFKSIRFPDEDPKTWNIVLGRNLPRTGEIIIWPRYSRTIPGLLSQGKPFLLTGNLEKGKNLEIMPVVTSAKTEGQKIDVQPGLNLKYGANSNLTLDLTANPDFSQVEADVPQIDLNLRYALYYQEKRPFFLEGMEIFRYPANEMVYTRRIIDPLFGARMTGKIGRFTYGLLTAYDQKPTESLWEVSNGGGQETIDRNALFNIFRVKADVFDQSYLGFTLADKEITGGAWNRVAGIDGMWRFKDRFFFSFQAMASDTKNEERNTALAPALYSEFYYYTQLKKKLHWGAGGYFQAMHPDFEASSGFVNRVDYRLTGLFTFFNLFTDKKYLNQVDLNLQVAQRDSYRGDLVQDKWFRARLQFRLTEFNRIFIFLTRSMERYAEIDFNKTTFYLEGQTTFLSWLPINFYFQTGHSINYDPYDPFLGYSNIFGLFLTLKPEKRLQLGLDLNWQTYWREWGGEKLWDYLVIRQKTTFQISKTLAIRTIVDYNDYYKKIFGSLLLSWVLRPGTLFYLGADSNYLQDEFGHYGRTNYGIFMKLSYWWRI
ncbi:MAG: carbohydrate binding family 9 domain-containing protein [Candidatus Saccharicenans sp.]|nr:carbohydrate binding family 9 domain-containing protein [Candidatus Saccharicenans sp.]MDH7493672.1 DUF5916 domain-containing protein [Candidatus Saccharicenans sp.]